MVAADLVPLLVQDGDLPVGMTTGQVRQELPNNRRVDGLPEPEGVAYVQLGKSGKSAGVVFLLLYEDAEDASVAWAAYLADAQDTTLKVDPPQESEQFGDQAFVWDVFTSVGALSQVGFTRCRAFVFIESDAMRDDSMAAYAKTVDRRISSAVCR